MSNSSRPERGLSTDVVCAILFLIVGGVWALTSWFGYRVGSTHAPGPGFFPLLSASGLAICGALLLLGALRQKAFERFEVEGGALKRLAIICLSTLIFALALPWFGFIIAGVALIVVSKLADPKARWRSTLLIALILTGACAAIFVGVLKISIPLLPIWWQ